MPVIEPLEIDHSQSMGNIKGWAVNAFYSNVQMS